MEEYNVGDRITLEVVESKSGKCDGCFYHAGADSCLRRSSLVGFCLASLRQDNKNVIFKLVDKK